MSSVAVKSSSRSRKRRRKAIMRVSKRKTRPHGLVCGDYVTWTESSTQTREEAQVIFQDATSVVVVNHLQVPMHHTPHTLKKTEWRERVRAGDSVQIKLYRCNWHIAVVRKIVYTAVPEDTVVYVEPAFLGRLVKVPLASLRLRQALPEDHKDFAPLLSSGFAFDARHADNSSSRTAANEHFGMLSAHHDSSGAWVVHPPCALPRFVRMVRQDNGVLAMCSTCDLLPELRSRE